MISTFPRIARSVLASSFSFSFCTLIAGSAHAHGFGQRFDLPIPLNFYLLGAATTVETAIRVLRRFERDGLIRGAVGRVRVLNAEQLRRMSGKHDS